MPRGKVALSAAALLAAHLVGCVAQEQYDHAVADLERARLYATMRDRENAALAWRQQALVYEIQIRDAQLQQVASAQQYVRKLEELAALNADLSKRLADAQQALEELVQRAADPDLAPRAQVEIEQLRQRRLDAAAQAASYEKLIRSIQGLVDAGKIKAVMREGRVQFVMPRPIDQTDPWR